MESRAKILGHPIHQVLIVFPLGLLATAIVFDVIYLFTGNRLWFGLSYWLIPAGLIGGLLAAPFGLIDWLAIPQNTRAKSIGLIHGLSNFLVLGLFFLSWWLRDSLLPPGIVALSLSFAGAAVSMLAAWLGGELVTRLGVGVDDDAHLDAPNSLFERSTRKL